MHLLGLGLILVLPLSHSSTCIWLPNFYRHGLDVHLQDDTKWGGLKAGRIMPEAKPIFARIELVSDADKLEVPTSKKKAKKTAKAQSA